MKFLNEKVVFISFFVVSTIVLYFWNFRDGGDNLFYATAAKNYPVGKFVFDRYFDWTGRVTSETLAYFFNGILSPIWFIINSLFLTLLTVIIYKYISALIELNKNKKALLAVFICLSFLFLNSDISTPALIWRTGSINYLWPVTMGFYIFYPFVLSLKNRFTSNKNNIFYFLIGLAGSAAMEQVSISLLLAISIFFAYMLYRRRKINSVIVFIAIFVVLGSSILFLAPGNQVRIHIEAERHFKDFFEMGFFNKISLSLYWILNRLINVCTLLLSFLYVILGVKLHLKKVNLEHSIISKICILIGVLLILKMLVNYEFIVLPINRGNILSPFIAASYLFMIFSSALVPYSLYLIFGKTKHIFLCLSLISLAIISMFAVSLSPTLDASGNRTLFLPCLLLVICVIFLIFQSNLKLSVTKKHHRVR